MTEDRWRELVLEAFSRYQAGDDEMVKLIAKLLAEQDAAKNAFIAAGIACTGMPWRIIAEEVIEEHNNR